VVNFKRRKWDFHIRLCHHSKRLWN